MKSIWTRYTPSYPRVILYMLQGSEYKTGEYAAWLHRTSDFRHVIKRRQLVWTPKAKLLAVAETTIIVSICAVAWFSSAVWLPLGLLVLLCAPFLLAYGVIIPLWIGEVIIQNPREKKMIAEAKEILKAHPAKKIAIAGSYGKTTTRHILATVLSEKYIVAATPGNMNTPIGTSRFVKSLSGNEQILLFEMGESHVGDIKELCDLVQPDIGIITGINQAHLESFGSLDNTIATMFELEDYLGTKPLYKNADDDNVATRLSADDDYAYTDKLVGRWHLKKSSGNLEGTAITVEKDGAEVKADTKLIGEHLVGTLLLAVALADYFDLSKAQIQDGLEKIEPFEHRMQPRKLHGALVIDDTYNGNIKGMESGLRLLKDSGAKRRVYVTPGLVEQGEQTEIVHNRIGKLAAESADIVVLMRNSVTDDIITGLQAGEFSGEIKIVEDPLKFYANLEHFVAVGDVVLMQNDWTDNYA